MESFNEKMDFSFIFYFYWIDVLTVDSNMI